MSQDLQIILNLLSEGKSAKEISKLFFSTEDTRKLINYLEKNNINLKQYETFKYMDKEWLSEQLKKYNNSPTILSRELNMSLTSVNRYAIEFGLRKPKKSIASVNPVNEKYFDENNIEYTLRKQLCKSGNYLHLIRIRNKSQEEFIELIYPPEKYALKRKYDLIYMSPQN